MEPMRKSAFVVVLGDIGRSPRMQNHAKSLADLDVQVHLIGYGGSALSEEVNSSSNISVYPLPPVPSFKGFPKLLVYVFKVIFQFFTLLWTFGKIVLKFKLPSFVLMQNPPSIPTLPTCYLFCCLFRSKLIVDWHNYGYTILSLARPKKNQDFLVKLSKYIEEVLGRRSDANFCVSNVMKNDLCHNWGITATTLYDRAPKKFGPCSISVKHDLFCKLSTEYKEFRLGSEEANLEVNVFTCLNNQHKAQDCQSRPGLLVSSTSWTEDEDFGILLEALTKYEQIRAQDLEDLPDLICVITGKGPLKEFYKQKLENLSWQHIKVVLPWLEPEDYPKILACADLGVSLHSSSSGLDLPMKVVDMFGSGLPVAALNFPALPELVKDGTNGFVFVNGSQLSDQLVAWFKGIARGDNLQKRFKKNLSNFQSLRWEEYWMQVAYPVIEEFL